MSKIDKPHTIEESSKWLSDGRPAIKPLYERIVTYYDSYSDIFFSVDQETGEVKLIPWGDERDDCNRDDGKEICNILKRMKNRWDEEERIIAEKD